MINKGVFCSKLTKSPSILIADTFRLRVLADNGIFEGYDYLISTIKSLRLKEIYERASIILTPNGFKNGKLYSLKPTNGNCDFSFTGGGGSRIDFNGNVSAISLGTPKIDYFNGYPEILTERTTSNILNNSETLVSQMITTNTQSYVLSFYGTGTVTINENTPITLVGNSIQSKVFKVFLSSGDSKSIIVNGIVKYAQIEPIGDPQFYNFPTSWIPTFGSSSNRTITSLLKTGLSSIIMQNEGSIYFEVKRQGRGSLFRVDDGTNNNAIRFFNTGYLGNNIEAVLTKNGIQSSNGTSAIPLVQTTKIALRYNTSSCDIYINGLFFVSLNNPGMFANPLSRISFVTTESTMNRFKIFAYIPYYVTTQELINFST